MQTRSRTGASESSLGRFRNIYRSTASPASNSRNASTPSTSTNNATPESQTASISQPPSIAMAFSTNRTANREAAQAETQRSYIPAFVASFFVFWAGMDTLAMVLGSLFSCCTNMFFHENLLRSAPNSQNFISLTQYIMIVLFGFSLGYPHWYRSEVPWTRYFPIAALNFIQLITHSRAHSFNLPMPIQIIFKSCSLIANLILGYFLFRRKYTKSKLFAAVVITMGLIITTFETYSTTVANVSEDSALTASDLSYNTLFGILFMIMSLFMQAMMGLKQDELSKEYPDYDPIENLFFVNLIGLPMMLLMYTGEALRYFEMFTTSHFYIPDRNMPNGLLDYWLLFFGIRYIPSLMVKLIIDNFMQLICVSCVFILTACLDSFTTTMVLTVRKFLSLIISIFYFEHPFTAIHWLGTLIVFLGILSFSLQDHLPMILNFKQHLMDKIGNYFGYTRPAEHLVETPRVSSIYEPLLSASSGDKSLQQASFQARLAARQLFRDLTPTHRISATRTSIRRACKK